MFLDKLLDAHFANVAQNEWMLILLELLECSGKSVWLIIVAQDERMLILLKLLECSGKRESWSLVRSNHYSGKYAHSVMACSPGRLDFWETLCCL